VIGAIVSGGPVLLRVQFSFQLPGMTYSRSEIVALAPIILSGRAENEAKPLRDRADETVHT